MAKSRNRKKKKVVQKQVKLKPENYVKKVARKLPIYECWISESWEEEMEMVQVFVAREKRNGDLLVGIYMIDRACLGVKSTFFRNDMMKDDFEEMIEDTITRGGRNLIKCDPNLAFNIVYGALEYAEDLGFSPDKDFKVTEYILDEVGSIEYMDIEFGSEGKPHYFAGPYESPAQVRKILNTLEKAVGADGFNYTLPIDEGNDDWDFEDEEEEEVYHGK